VIAGGASLVRGLRARRLTPFDRLAFLGLLALALFWFVAARTPRFNLPLFGLAAALAGRAADALGTGRARHTVGFLAVGAAAVTLRLTFVYQGWDFGPPTTRAERLELDHPAVPSAIDALPPLVICNDTTDDESARPSNYWLFGADRRHMVYECRDEWQGEASEFLARLRGVGINAVFRRARLGVGPPRYATQELEVLANCEATEYRGTLYRVRAPHVDTEAP
jgi:hypothetical protein